ncbi:MAG: response regulator [Bacteroidetes bacterium]|nr:response regulator [Bacteroidota bacterium]
MKKILVIEDNETILENIAEILELSAYEVVVARNGREGIEISEIEKPDMIICDIMMPEMDGYQVLTSLNKESGSRNIPFIFLTAKSEKNDFKKAAEMGADYYLTKPFGGAELINAVETIFKNVSI